MLPADIVWRPSTGIGYEHLKVREDNNQIFIDSIVIGSQHNNEIFRIRYDIVLDQSWVTRAVTIRYLGEDQGLSLSSDGKGIWKDEQGQIIPELSGCIDIDISCTPFTNTLPINRLSYEPSQQQEIQVVYISAAELNYKPVKQNYTLLESRKDSSVFRYQSGNFMENITVDSNGIVVVYPNLFYRETGPDAR
ncbi:putative glycolipid-binding domain-containing protein [Paenibacillus tyrfis]|uniref:putative glycolipid-binding domain-containing protein n=1 Tax=Paenibacillus tyrfis TaxID=1501230 RepID=UPI00209EDFBE|nr:putative glycolipid-binding domain-containing protein [Paenibacillus tyrfis]MCP1305716.1 putative glycolipid-binding domain-containing protein [Paenibacillus tyrfis]